MYLIWTQRNFKRISKTESINKKERKSKEKQSFYLKGKGDSMSDIIRMTSVKYGKNENHLHFRGFIPRKDPNLQYDFDFIGIDIDVSTFLPQKAKEQLVNALREDYGYAPFDINKVKAKFGNGKDYEVDSVAGI